MRSHSANIDRQQDGSLKPFYIFWGSLVVAFAGIFFMSFPGGMFAQKILLCLLSLICLIFKRGRIYVPAWLRSYLYILIFLTFFSFFSAFSSFGSIVSALLVSQKFLMLLVSFILASYVAKIFSEKKNINKIRITIYFLIFSQFGFALLKLLILGKIDEGFLIGSMHHNAGQLGFLFPALMIPIIVFLFANNRPTIISLILIITVILFAIINEKRAIFFLGIPIIVLSFYACQRRTLSLLGVARLAVVVLPIFLILAFSTSQVGSLSGKEAAGKIAGSGPSFLLNYAIEYLTMDYGGALQADESLSAEDANVQVGRLIVISKSIDYMRAQSLNELFFGNGMGFITPSEYINPPDIMYKKLGFRGAISGAAQMFIEGGLVGLVFMSLLLIGPLVRTLLLIKRSKRNTYESAKYRKLCAICLLLLAICIFDFFLYSTTLLTTFPLPLLFFFILFALPNIHRPENAAKRKIIGQRNG